MKVYIVAVRDRDPDLPYGFERIFEDMDTAMQYATKKIKEDIRERIVTEVESGENGKILRSYQLYLGFVSVYYTQCYPIIGEEMEV